MKKIILLLLLLKTFVFFGQNPTQQQVLAKAAHDSVRCRLLNGYFITAEEKTEKQQLNLRLEKIIEKNLKSNNLNHKERKTFLWHKAQMLSNYGKIHNDNDSLAIEYYKKSLIISTEIDDKPTIAETYNTIGVLNYYLFNYPEALKNHAKALTLFKSLNDQEGLARSNNNIGLVYDDQGNYSTALKYYYNSLKIKEELNDIGGIASSYNNIGMVFRLQGKYTQAVENLQKALNYYKQDKDLEGEGDVYTNIGIIYIEQAKYHEAIDNHKKAIALFEQVNDLKGVGLAYGNLASAYMYQGNYTDALTNYNKALDIKLQTNDKKGSAYMYIGIGMTHQKLNNPAKAKQYLQNALLIAQKGGAKAIIKNCYHNIAVADSTLGNYKSAFENYKLYTVYKDSLENEDIERKSLQTIMQYDFEKKEALIKQDAENQKKRQRVVLIATTALLVLSILLLITWFYFYKKKKKTEKILHEKELSLQIAEEERRRISADLHDDLGPGMAGLTIASDMLAMRADTDGIRIEAQKIAENSKKISSRLSEVIWELNMEHDNLEDLLLFIQKQGKKYFKHKDIEFSMRLPLEIPSIAVLGTTRRQMYLAVKECFHNTYKHAEAETANCEAIFDTKQLTLVISDNGKGFDTSEKNAGEGLKNLEYRLNKINGKVEIISSPNGTSVTIRIPLVNT